MSPTIDTNPLITRPYPESGKLCPTNLMNDTRKNVQVAICIFCDIPSIKSMCVNKHFFEIINDSRFGIWRAVEKC